ncbi:MAG: hypothetical protein QXL96_04975 [Ignisphaera sp.]
MLKRKKTRIYDKVVLIYTFMVIGILIFASGLLYMVFFGAVDTIVRPYTISIPRKYYGEIVLSPSGGVRLSLRTVTEIHNISIRKGAIENITMFEIKNASFYIVSVKVYGRNINSSPVSLVVSLKRLDDDTYVGSTLFVNKSNYASGEMPLTSYLGEGRYLLELMSKEDMIINYIAIRGLRYENITNPILSITFNPQEFNHQTLYYIEKIDLKNLWISIAMITSGTIILIVSFMIFAWQLMKYKFYNV